MNLMMRMKTQMKYVYADHDAGDNADADEDDHKYAHDK